MTRMTTIQKVRTIVITAACLLILIIILQNTRVVETRLLFITVSMPMALLLIITFVAGFASGTLFASGLLKRPEKTKAKVHDKA